ncbi:hypothetical protein ACFLTV_03330, partial [Chloroflexota bacterium]
FSATGKPEQLREECLRFLPHSGQSFDSEQRACPTIPFKYRPLTEQEEIKYGQRNQQDTISQSLSAGQVKCYWITSQDSRLAMVSKRAITDNTHLILLLPISRIVLVKDQLSLYIYRD